MPLTIASPEHHIIFSRASQQRPQPPSHLGDGNHRVTRNPPVIEKGRSWIFNLSTSPTKGTQLSLKILAQIMGERGEERRGGRNPSSWSSKCARMSQEVREKEGEPLLIH
jgi:hypothetical protein